MGDYKTAEKVGYIPSLNSGCKEIINRGLVADFITQPFEGRNYYVPIGYDTYLRQLYGNYMMPPLEEQRQSTHIFQAWWRD